MQLYVSAVYIVLCPCIRPFVWVYAEGPCDPQVGALGALVGVLLIVVDEAITRQPLLQVAWEHLLLPRHESRHHCPCGLVLQTHSSGVVGPSMRPVATDTQQWCGLSIHVAYCYWGYGQTTV